MQNISIAIKKNVQKLFGIEIDVELSRTDEKFGDYSVNVAMQIAGRVGVNPREVAERIVAELRNDTDNIIKDISIAGPGFINLTLADEYLADLALKSVEYLPESFAGKVEVIETNNPNPFKDMHIGHAYNCIVADTLANFLEAGGAKVHRVSYHGDVGLHVGKSMWAILNYIQGDINKLHQISENKRASFMSKMYVEGAGIYDEDLLVRQQIEAYAKESFDPQDKLFKEVYETCKQWSFDYFEKLVEWIGSRLVEKRYLEHEADKLGADVVKKNLGKVFEQSDGAIIFKGEDYGLHTRVFIAARGTSLYEARDLGLMQLKSRDYSPDTSYIVTGKEQKEYFRVVCKAAELAMPELNTKTQNVPTGLVKLTTGKMSSRTGQVVNIEWLFETLRREIIDRYGDSSAVGDTIVGALRYTMLRVGIGSDVVFDVNESISLEGNTGPYLQYAHARARSILRKAEKMVGEVADLTADERLLARKVSEYTEVIDKAVSDLAPHAVCNYLYELSQVFNRFYEKNRVVGDERESARLALVQSYAEVLKCGLGVLGIPAPEKV